MDSDATHVSMTLCVWLLIQATPTGNEEASFL